MARRKTSTLTEVELEFMQILWAVKKASPEDMQNALLKKGRTLTGGTIRKVLLILMKKGYIEREKQSKKYIYNPKVQKNQANRGLIQDLLTRAFDGSAFLMVAALLDSHPVPKEDIEKIEHLIADAKKDVQK